MQLTASSAVVLLWQLCLLLLAHAHQQRAAACPQPTVIDVARHYGNISFQSISSAMERAQQIVVSGAGAIVFLQAGKHTVDMTDGHLFDVSGIVPEAGCRLVVAGAGMFDTTLVTRTHGNDVIHARRGPEDPMWRRVSFENITFAREGQTTTQGRLLSADEGGIELEVAEGFPRLDELMQLGEAKPSMWFRRYTYAFASADASKGKDADTPPRLVMDQYNNSVWKPLVNQQVPFSCCSSTSNATCQHSASVWICPDVLLLPGNSRQWRLSVTKWPVQSLSLRVSVCAACTLNATGQSRVTLSLR